MIRSFIVFLLSLLYLGCSTTKPPSAEILVSIAPYQFLVEQIVQGTYQVRSIVPPKANSHFFEPSPSMLSSLGSAKIWFQIGEPFEKKLSATLKTIHPTLQEKDLRHDIPLLSYEGSHCCSLEEKDIHIWMNPLLLAQQAKIILQSLSQIFPENQALFTKNYETLLEKLLSLDEKIRTYTKNIPNRSLIVAHPALGYFCQEYDFQQISLEWEGKELSLKQVQNLLQQMQFQKPLVVIFMPQHPKKGALYISEHLQVPLVEINPYAEEYFLMMSYFAETLAKL